MDKVGLLVADVDPADKEENPSQTEERDESGVKGDEETQRSANILSKALQASLHSRAARVQHVSHMIIQLSFLLGRPSLKSRPMWKGSVVRIGKTRSNSVASLHGRGVFVDCFGDGGCLGTFILGCFATTFFGGSTASPFGLRVVAG